MTLAKFFEMQQEHSENLARVKNDYQQIINKMARLSRKEVEILRQELKKLKKFILDQSAQVNESNHMDKAHFSDVVAGVMAN